MIPRSGHEHVPARRVLAALGVTVAAAAIELGGSWGGHSLFLIADALHLLAHVGIFVVLLTPPVWWHDRGEDVAAIAVLALVTLIGAGVTIASVRHLVAAVREPPVPAVMLLSLLGLGANLTSAYLFADPARRRWSFRAALAHELSDASLTVAGLVGALAIALFGWRWIDPTLSLAIGVWLGVWALRLLDRRVRFGREVWRRVEEHGARAFDADHSSGTK